MAIRRTVPVLTAALAIGLMAAPMAQAGRIENACKQSNRSSAAPQLCNCIQQVADKMLTRRDQKLAATFFKEPHKAQEIRQSDRRKDERFWDRYKSFGSAASRSCS